MDKMIVIGASRGLGLCLVRRLLEKGCRVAAGVLLPGDREKLLQDCDLADLETAFQVNAFGPIRDA